MKQIRTSGDVLRSSSRLLYRQTCTYPLDRSSKSSRSHWCHWETVEVAHHLRESIKRAMYHHIISSHFSRLKVFERLWLKRANIGVSIFLSLHGLLFWWVRFLQDALNNGHPAIHILGLLGHALRRIHGLCLQGYILRRPCNDVMSMSESNTAPDYSRTGRLEEIRWLDTITLGLG